MNDVLRNEVIISHRSRSALGHYKKKLAEYGLSFRYSYVAKTGVGKISYALKKKRYKLSFTFNNAKATKSVYFCETLQDLRNLFRKKTNSILHLEYDIFDWITIQKRQNAIKKEQLAQQRTLTNKIALIERNKMLMELQRDIIEKDKIIEEQKQQDRLYYLSYVINEDTDEPEKDLETGKDLTMEEPPKYKAKTAPKKPAPEKYIRQPSFY